MTTMLTKGEVRDWMEDTKIVYASRKARGQKLRLMVGWGARKQAVYEVMFGNDRRYEGGSLKAAVECYNSLVV